MTACNSNTGISMQATGTPYEIVVSVDKKNWEGEVGQAVKADLESDIPGLPQPESSFRIMYALPDNFGTLLRYVPNILFVNINDRMYTAATLQYENDRWAKGQAILTMSAPDAQSVLDFLSQHKNEISRFFSRVEMNRATVLLEKSFNAVVRDTLKQQFDILLNIPPDMKAIRGKKDFFWVSNDAKKGRTDLIVYTFPYTDVRTFTADYLVAKRDSVLKQNLPGAFPDSYMATETLFDVDYSAITLRGKYCGVMRGLWKMVGDMMGGPFVSHIRLDEANHRIVVVEGFVYAPETNKRNFIRKIESALYTLRLPGEFDQPVAEPFTINKGEN
jgi:hypothetical protein